MGEATTNPVTNVFMRFDTLGLASNSNQATMIMTLAITSFCNADTPIYLVK